jgi:hypothetical protein
MLPQCVESGTRSNRERCNQCLGHWRRRCDRFAGWHHRASDWRWIRVVHRSGEALELGFKAADRIPSAADECLIIRHDIGIFLLALLAFEYSPD